MPSFIGAITATVEGESLAIRRSSALGLRWASAKAVLITGTMNVSRRRDCRIPAGQNDRDRYQLEAGTRLVRHLAAAVREPARGSLHDGHEHAADFPTFRLGILVRADDGHETYVAVRITGSIPEDLIAVILRPVPGCDPTVWYPEYGIPSRPLLPAEQAWSTLMDPKAAAELLNEE